VTNKHDLEEEQAFLDHAHASLQAMRVEAAQLRDSVMDLGRGGTFQSRTERDIVVRSALARLEQLDIGDQALCFGRIDVAEDAITGQPDSFHIGRLAVSGPEREPLVVDWRAPIAEPFYRATGRDPLGLTRRRHLNVKRQQVLGVEDEYFSDDEGTFRALDPQQSGQVEPDGLVKSDAPIGGPGALFAALGRARSGQMGDIIATIQAEQDEIIRAPLNGALMVQGGPGTGKTAVALHRAAYLLYTHRFPLESQGVLVVGPNPLFLRYIEQVLPSLGETGVTLSTVSGLVKLVVVSGTESSALAKVKGSAAMAKVIARAIRLRQRTLREPFQVPFGGLILRMNPDQSKQILERATRRSGSHNLRRRFVEAEAVRLFAKVIERRRDASEFDDDQDGEMDLKELRSQLRQVPEFIELLNRLWPRLSPHELLHDLYGSLALLNAAGKQLLTDAEIRLLARPRSESLDDVRWTDADVALIDEAQALLGPRHEGAKRRVEVMRDRDGMSWPEGLDGRFMAETQEISDEEIRAYGHLVVDEVQDLSPMQLRMLARRTLNGSMTVVGDVAQSTAPWTPSGWSDIEQHLTPTRVPQRVELTVSYRTPAEVLEMATPVLREGAPEILPPTPVRRAGIRPLWSLVASDELLAATVKATKDHVLAIGEGRVAVLASAQFASQILEALVAEGLDAVDPRIAGSRGLSAPVVVVPVDEANGLEFDAVTVVEPMDVALRGAANGATTPTVRGLRTLYVAMTRPTRRLTLVATKPGPVDFAEWTTTLTQSERQA
jgi:hypothetical protein